MTPISNTHGSARLSLNQATVKTTPLPELIELLAEHGIQSIGLWRDSIATTGLESVKSALKNSGLRVSSYTTGGFTSAPKLSDQAVHVDHVRRCLDEATELGAQAVVMRAGGLPEGSHDLDRARKGVAAAIVALEPHAAACGVPITLEPLHPMFAADRGVVVTLDHALDIVEACDPRVVGVALDVYNSWWDPNLVSAIIRGSQRIRVVQIADWMMPFSGEPVTSRGMIGDGSIDFGPVFSALQSCGYRGDVEVEIFNEGLWNTPARSVVSLVKERFQTHISPLL